MDVRGLNTAATVWCVGSVGSLVGAHFALVALGAAALLIAMNALLH